MLHMPLNTFPLQDWPPKSPLGATHVQHATGEVNIETPRVPLSRVPVPDNWLLAGLLYGPTPIVAISEAERGKEGALCRWNLMLRPIAQSVQPTTLREIALATFGAATNFDCAECRSCPVPARFPTGQFYVQHSSSSFVGRIPQLWADLTSSRESCFCVLLYSRPPEHGPYTESTLRNSSESTSVQPTFRYHGHSGWFISYSTFIILVLHCMNLHSTITEYSTVRERSRRVREPRAAPLFRA